MAGCAVSASTAIGLDIEPITRRPQWQKVVKRWFSSQEAAWLLAADDPEAFLRVWTLKEAWLKATGRGIADNLQTLTVTADTELTGDRPHQPWQASLGRSGGHMVAVVYQGHSRPQGTGISGQIDLSDLSDLETSPLSLQPVKWILHRQIDAL
jgi:4'-phosphopantetheinyl transferase